MQRIAFVLILALLAGCAPRASIVIVPDAASGGAIESVFVASNRVYDGSRFTSDRLEGLGFTRFDVAIPPNREVGEVNWPRGEVDLEADFVVSQAGSFADAAAFRRGLRAAVAAQPENAREVMVFVHGFNNTFADGLFRTAQIRNDFEIPGVALHYAWPSLSSPFGYAYDRDSALFARDGLERFLREIAAAGSHDIVIVAHSVGSELVMEALRQLRIGGADRVLDRISGVVLMSPDIDVQVFRSQAMRILPLPEPFFIFTSQRDRALRLSARISGQPARLGNIGTIDDVAEFNVTLIDVSEFRGGDRDALNHNTVVTSPAMIRLLSRVDSINSAFEGQENSPIGLLPGTILTLQNATQVILTPNL
ncbi:alpha/beta hydrolase [Rhodophyticola sp.]|jgi:esterase/lipase superfamily enzyme|uniref:alpha/beta hydrolase n=1 Tax=Rhodophyticola sp. TaxID=2680032 RepID=UPI003D26763F